jgi:MFS transporter, DHA1 family, inner membrane transport protein
MSPHRLKSATGTAGPTILLAFAAFVIVTTEFVIVGLLPMISRNLDVSIAAAGQLITVFGLTVMLFGPVLTAFLSHIERRRLFVVILVVFAVSNALAAGARNIWVLGLARFLAALMLPVFWGTASETAGQLAGRERTGQAVATVYLGISAALLFGIPLGTLSAQAVGWRGTFWIMSALSALMALLLLAVMPLLVQPQQVRIREQTRILQDPHFVANLVLSILVFTAMFTGYTYLADTLERVVGVAQAYVGWWLMGFGAIGLIGNWLGGWFVGRGPLVTTFVFTVLLGLGMAAVVPSAGSHLWTVTALATWGIANTALYPVSQVRVMQAASHSQALAGTLNVSAANAGIAFGAILGGLTIKHWGIASVGNSAAAFAALAACGVPLVSVLKRSPAVGRQTNPPK